MQKKTTFIDVRFLLVCILLFLGFSTKKLQAQCPTMSALPISPTCPGANNGMINVSLFNVSGLYNIALYIDVIPTGLVPVANFLNQTGNSFSFTNLVPSDRYIVVVSFPTTNPVPSGCGSILASPPVVINNPSIIFNPVVAPNICQLAPPRTIFAMYTGSASGVGTFTGAGISTSGVFNPTTAGVGTHTITYTYVTAACTITGSQNITVTATPILSFNITPTTICRAGGLVPLTATPTGGTFSGLGVTGTNLDPNVGANGIRTITYSFTQNGCTRTATSNINIVVNTTVSLLGLLPIYCTNAPSVTPTVSPAGGTLTGNGISGGIFSPASAGVGFHTLTYTVLQNNCTFTATQTVEVRNPTVVVTFTNLSPTYCVNAVPFGLTASLNGGTFSGAGVVGNVFTPSNAGIGTHLISYAYNDAGCAGIITQNVQVVAPVTVSFSGLPVVSPVSYCKTAPALTLTGTPAGGVFSGNGVSGNTFNPNNASVIIGVNAITYTVTQNNCTISSTQNIIITAPPVIVFGGLNATYCLTSPDVNIAATPAGGTFSGVGVCCGNVFSPATAGVGIHTVTYSITNNGCTTTQTQSVEVISNPVVSIVGLSSPYCLSSGTVTLVGTPAGGTFTGTGVSGTVGNYIFNPAVAGIGFHTINYAVVLAGCSFNTFQVVEVKTGTVTPTISGLGNNYCQTAPSVNITGTPAGGTFVGAGMSGNTFNPSVAGVGTHTITYNFNSGGCTSSAIQTVNVTPTPVIAFASTIPSAICLSGGNIALAATPVGGTFSGLGVTGSTFSPTTAGVGTTSIIYTYTENGCTVTNNVNINVTPTPVLAFGALPTQYCVSATSLTLSATPAGGVFSGAGVALSGANYVFSPTIATVGTHILIYTFIQNGCTITDTRSITVTATPVVSISGLLTNYCNDLTSVPLVGVPASTTTQGVFSGAGVSGTPGNYIFNPNAAGNGIKTITYTYIDNGCTVSVTQNTTVAFCDPCLGVTISATISTTQPTTCGETGTIVVSAPAGGTAPYTYSFAGGAFGTTASFSTLLPNTYVIIVKDAIGCSHTYSPVINAYIGISVTSITQTPVNCAGESNGTISLVATGGNGNYQYSLDNVTFQPLPTFNGLIGGNYTVFVKDNLSCTATATITVVAPSTLSATATATNPSNCILNNGVITFSNIIGGNGANQFSIDGGLNYSTALVFSNLAAGTYPVAVRDAKNCTWTSSVVIGFTNNLAGNVTTFPASCGGTNGQVLAQNASGGGGTYVYSLDNLNYQANPLFMNLAAGSYTLYVKDPISLCFTTVPAVVGSTSGFTANLSITQPTSCGVGNGIITVSAPSGGVAPYEYSLDGVTYQTSPTFSGLSGGNYSIHIKDSNNCPLILTAQLTGSTSPIIIGTPTGVSPSCSGVLDGQVSITSVSGGVAPYHYSLDNVTFQTSPVFAGLADGFYTIYVKDASNCVQNTTYTLAPTNTLTFSIVQVSLANCSNPTAKVEVRNVAGGVAPYQYSMDGINYTSNNVFENVPAGSYTCYVKDARVSNCVTQRSVVVDGTKAFNYVLAQQNLDCKNGLGNIKITAIVGGTLPYVLTLKKDNQLIKTETIFVDNYVFAELLEGNYTLSVTNVSTCAIADKTIILKKSIPLAATVSTTKSLITEPTGSILIEEISGGTAPYSVSIDSAKTFKLLDDNFLTVNNLAVGAYVVVVRDAVGCEFRVRVVIEESLFAVPNVFTPNNDGKNETFFIENLPKEGAYLRISNRWGKAVYETSNYQNDWKADGLSDGVYFYILQIPNKANVAGNVQVWR